MFFYIKRFFDFFISLSVLIIIFPILLIVCISIFICDLHNPFFVQERSGQNGKKINILKLQTMKIINGKKKVTNFGKFLRTSKIDELPQLINVLKNDMSLVGPRPLYVEFNSYYKKKHKLRLSVKPGITGLAQIKVKDSTDWNKKFNYDVIYSKKINFKLDFYILFKTFFKILSSLIIKSERPIESFDYKKNFFENYK